MLPARTSIRAQKTRATILNSAITLFKDKGFAATTMRDIAESASMAVGATYYHFRTKDEIIFAFYESTQAGSEERAQTINNQTNDFAERIVDIIEFKLKQFEEYREFLGQLASHALVPKSPLSPFSKETTAVRNRAIAIFEEAIRGSNLKIGKELLPHLPRLLWLYQMAVILYWFHDTSPSFTRSKKLISLTQNILMKLITLSRVPLMRPLNRTVLALLELFPEDAQ